MKQKTTLYLAGKIQAQNIPEGVGTSMKNRRWWELGWFMDVIWQPQNNHNINQNKIELEVAMSAMYIIYFYTNLVIFQKLCIETLGALWF